MGFQSQTGQVGFKTQGAAGTYADPATDGVFALLRSGSLGPNRDLLVPDPEIGGGRDTVDAYLGAVSWAGDYEFYARSVILATLLRGALGASTSAGTDDPATTTVVENAAPFTHTITPSAAAVPWLSVEENIAGNLETFRFTDAKVNTLHLESDANGYLMGTAGLIAKTGLAGQTKTAAPDFDTNPMFVGTNIFVTYNGVTLPAKSFSWDITNNMEDDDFRLGSFYLGDVTEKQREVSASVTVRPQDSALWRQATLGTSAATAPGGQTTKHQLVITAETYEVITGTTAKHKVTLTMPRCVIEPFGLDPSGDDVLEHDLAFRALKMDQANIMTAQVVNELATIR